MFNKKYKQEIKKLKSEVEELNKQNLEYNKNLEDKYLQVLKDKEGLQGRAVKAEKKNREQTEADLFLISVKICKKLLEGEKKENMVDLFRRQSRLQMLAARQQPVPISLSGGLLGASSLFGV